LVTEQLLSRDMTDDATDVN